MTAGVRGPAAAGAYDSAYRATAALARAEEAPLPARSARSMITQNPASSMNSRT